MRRVLVQDVMSSPAIVIASQCTLSMACALMKQCGIRRLPVVDNGKLVGMITLGDVHAATSSDARVERSEPSHPTGQLEIAQVMTRQVITVTPDSQLGEAARLMHQNQISGLPIVSSDGRIVGIVTKSDISRVLVESRESNERPMPIEYEGSEPRIAQALSGMWNK